MCLGLNLNSRNFSGLTRLSFSCGETCVLVSWCIGDRCDMVGSNEDWCRSRRLGAVDQGWSSTCRVLVGRTIEKSGDILCGLHRAQRDEERGFLGLASNQGRQFLPVWPQNRWLRFLWFGLKTTRSGFLDWASKPIAIIWWFGPQNHHDGFLVCASKSYRLWFIGCTTKPTGRWRRRGTRVKI
jgi:hypothetical protein